MKKIMKEYYEQQQIKKIIRNKSKYYMMIRDQSIHQDTAIQSVCAAHSSLKIHEAKTDKDEKRNRQIHNCTQGFQTPTCRSW